MSPYPSPVVERGHGATDVADDHPDAEDGEDEPHESGDDPDPAVADVTVDGSPALAGWSCPTVNRRPNEWSLIRCCALALCLAMGCAGGLHTARIPDLETPGRAALQRRVELARVRIAPDANSLHAVGTQRTGGFGLRDRAALAASLRATLATVAWPRSLPPSRRLQLDVLLGRYLAVYTKAGGAVLACLAWTLQDGNGTVVHRAHFYVADSGSSFRRMIVRGNLKPWIEAASVERISRTALLVASGKPGSEIPPIAVEGTYDTLDEAVSGLPHSFTAVAPKGSYVRREIDWTRWGRCIDE